MVTNSGTPIEVTLATIPGTVYKENDGVTEKGPTESWLFYVVVRERNGRRVKPSSASVRLYWGRELVGSVDFSKAALEAIMRVSFKDHACVEELFDLRHHFSAPASLAVNRIRYKLKLTTAKGETIEQPLWIPVRGYEQKVQLKFPLKGRFVIASGCELFEPHRRAAIWSQHFAYDVLATGPNYEVVKNEAKKTEDFFGWGHQILAPASGSVVHAENDIPDNTQPGKVDRNVSGETEDSIQRAVGNCVVIDHGNEEYSFLAHLQRGSVRVRTGDIVRRGDVVGFLGNSGNSLGPHLHYHLMTGKDFLTCDGLPSRFENTETPVPRRGIPMEAK